MQGGITTTLLLGMPPLPAPPPLMQALQKVEVESSTEVASVFRLRFRISQTQLSDWDLLQLQYQESLFRPLTPVQIRVKVGISLPMALINGYVTSQQVNYDDQAGGSVLEVTGMDATMLMNLEEKVMAWPAMPDSVIAAAIFGQYTIVPSVSPTMAMLVEPEGTTTQRGTDIRFLRRLAQRNGFDCYVQPDPITGLDTGHFEPPMNLPAPPAAVLNVKMGAETNVTDFKIRYDMARPTTALGAGLDVKTRAPFAFPALVPATPPPAGGLYPLGTPMGVENSVLRAVAGAHPPPMVLPAETGQFMPPGLISATQAIVNRSSWALVAEGAIGPDVAVLHPGGTVNVRGAGMFFNGSYFLSRISHSIDNCGSYVQKFEARRNAALMTGAELYVQI
ncbi:MAG TPA: hypothetical protein VGS20_08625 [Candidatus Acidoferrales bacterium]|nr:hypothetical protein [Candidatus Acidoferrales bacterium]